MNGVLTVPFLPVAEEAILNEERTTEEERRWVAKNKTMEEQTSFLIFPYQWSLSRRPLSRQNGYSWCGLQLVSKLSGGPLQFVDIGGNRSKSFKH
jgi:hypothetical protein